MKGYQELTGEQWVRLKPLLPYGSTGQRGRNANNCRFIDALIWLARSGGRWRDLPARIWFLCRGKSTLLSVGS